MHRLNSLDFSNKLLKAIVVACVLVLSGILGKNFVESAWGLRELFVITMAIIAVLTVLIGTEKMLLGSYYLCIALFATGWRQGWLTSQIAFHASEAFIWSLFAVLVTRKVIHRRPIGQKMPKPVILLLSLGGLGFLIASTRGRPWGLIIYEFKLFLVLIPVLYVTEDLLTDKKRLLGALWMISIVGFYVSLLGLLEYMFPKITAPLRGFFGGQAILYSQHGFAREDFTFWGGAMASALLTIVAFPTLSLALRSKTLFQRLFLFITFAFCNVGVYLSGNRGMWLALAMALLAYVLISGRRGWPLLIPYALLLPFLPKVAYHHIYAVFDPIQYYDTSVLKRRQRLQAVLKLIRRSPFWGHGWGGSGWTHCDLAQIAANLGIPALLTFLWWYLSLMQKLYSLSKGTSPWGEYARGLLATLAGGLVLLATENLVVLPPLIIPFWFILALAGQLVTLAERESAKSDYPSI